MAVVAVAAGAVTVDVVLVVAVTPAVGVWEDERVRTGVSGGDWLPAVADSGGALATTRATAWKKNKKRIRVRFAGRVCAPASSQGNHRRPEMTNTFIHA